MKIGNSFSVIFPRLGFALVILLTLTARLSATTHIIQFQFPTFTPNTMDVTVGDTIKWIGDFSGHPLQSTAVPSGAQDFGPIVSGTEFEYPVLKAGNYAYQCNRHISQGMTGTFTAIKSAVGTSVSAPKFTLAQNFPNPVFGSTTIKYKLDGAKDVSFGIFDIQGKEVHHISVGSDMSGLSEVSLAAGTLKPGVYFYRIITSDAVLSRRMVVLWK